LLQALLPQSQPANDRCCTLRHGQLPSPQKPLQQTFVPHQGTPGEGRTAPNTSIFAEGAGTQTGALLFFRRRHTGRDPKGIALEDVVRQSSPRNKQGDSGKNTNSSFD
jgi:hypothetical protein